MGTWPRSISARTRLPIEKSPSRSRYRTSSRMKSWAPSSARCSSTRPSGGDAQTSNLVSIYDAGVAEDLCYIAMEYVRGDRTLHEHCTPERLLPVVDAVQIIFKCAKALDHAHRLGVIHRDIKPRNVLLTEDRDVKIADFGIALLTRTDTTRHPDDGLRRLTALHVTRADSRRQRHYPDRRLLPRGADV